MYILRIEHPVPDVEGWKKAFDSDPVGREKSGVRRYQVLRPIDDEHFVTLDLEFDTMSQAEALLAAMRVVWGRVDGTIMMNPQARILRRWKPRNTATREFTQNRVWSRSRGAKRFSIQ